MRARDIGIRCDKNPLSPIDGATLAPLGLTRARERIDGTAQRRIDGAGQDFCPAGVDFITSAPVTSFFSPDFKIEANIETWKMNFIFYLFEKIKSW